MVAVQGGITAAGGTPVEEEVAEHRPEDHAQKQPHTECHRGEHEEVAEDKLDALQQRLQQMVSAKHAPRHGDVHGFACGRLGRHTARGKVHALGELRAATCFHDVENLPAPFEGLERYGHEEYGNNWNAKNELINQSINAPRA